MPPTNLCGSDEKSYCESLLIEAAFFFPKLVELFPKLMEV